MWDQANRSSPTPKGGLATLICLILIISRRIRAPGESAKIVAASAGQ